VAELRGYSTAAREGVEISVKDERSIAAGYDFRTTPYLQSLLQGRPADDPLSLQFLPQEQELTALSHETSDPIGDMPFSPVAGVVHRHPDRVLLKVAHSCPVYCRFCFRRDMIGSKGEPLQGPKLQAAIGYIRAHPKIWEVILTGGDPLSLSSRRLHEILGSLATIPHVSILRIHSRVPIVAPHSVDDSYIRALQQPLPVYLAVHVNHPDELTEAVVMAVRRLSEAGIVLLSQTVLLKGVNDHEAVLEALFRQLVRLKVRPYYLHHADLARGTSHFRVPIEVGQRLMRSLRRTVSGLCLPTYVLDIPGGFGKVPIGPTYVGARDASGCRQIEDSSGTSRSYPE
jgi:lysine 2,3-aminomutase